MADETNIADFPQRDSAPDDDRPPPRHKWGDRVTVVDNTSSGCEQGERTCVRCGIVRVTVHPPRGLPWREWRPRGCVQIQLSSTPPCLGDRSS